MPSKDFGHAAPERRGYFRVRDEIILLFNELHQEEGASAQGLNYQVVNGFSLSSALNRLSEESRTHIKLLEKDHPDLIACLRILEKKLDLIAQAYLISNLALPSKPAREVELSASGIAFAVENPIEPDTLLELKMILPPSLVAIVTQGRVVHCERNAEESEGNLRFTVAVEFVGLADYDRELLIRHILSKEKSAIRNRR
ncbi:MAG: PilZ domain-containing protein [Gammaproteobacteria bacterium]